MSRPAPKSSARNEPPPTVSGRWLLKAVGAIILVALVFSYISLALLYYQGQWQIVLHPDATVRNQHPPADLIHFSTDETGRTQLTGELLTAGIGSRYSDVTVLFLAGGDGSRKNSQETIEALHQIGLNVFSFDYRGYGFSASMHPSQQRMTEDSDAAWHYLTSSRSISPKSIVLYGTGVGTSLAARLAHEHAEVPALILDAPHADLLQLAHSDSRSSLLPSSLLFHENFPLAAQLGSLSTPKLLISLEGAAASPAVAVAAAPKMTVDLPADSGPLFTQAITRFLDQYHPLSH